MRHKVLFTSILMLTASAVPQTAEKPFRYNGLGYVYGSVGECTHGYFNAGGGGGAEAFLWRGLTLGGDVGYFKFPADRNDGYGVATLNVGWHFVDRSRPKKFDPYVDFSVLGAGFARGGVAAAGHLGGGVNYWFKQRVGLRTGVVLQVMDEEPVMAFRFGVTFR